MKHRRSDGERGAAAVEFAIVLPVLIVILFGIIEYGLLFREKLTIASAAASSARTGATMGIRDDADYRILQALEAGLYDQVDTGVLIRVEIFQARPVDGTKTGLADVYKYLPPDQRGTGTCKWEPCPDLAEDGPVGTWLPADRDTTLEPGGGGLDVLGIEIVYHHSAVTNLIPGIERDSAERALVRLEPAVFGTSSG